MFGEAFARNATRWNAFLTSKPSDRPLLALYYGMFLPEAFPETARRLPVGEISPKDIPIEPFLEDIDKLYETYVQFDDDIPYAAAALIYVPWMEAILGCPVLAADNSLWVDPIVRDWDSWLDSRLPLEENPWFQKLLEMTRALVQHSRGRYPVGQTLMRGISDCLSTLRGASVFALDFIDNPQEVRKAARKVADVFIEVAKAQLALIPSSALGYISSGCHRAWAPEPMVWLQEDALSLLSPTIFREFILPEDRRILNQFTWTGFHLHGNVPWAVEDIAGLPELTVLNYCFESVQPNEDGTFSAFKMIQAFNKPLAAWKELDNEQFWLWLERFFAELEPRGLLLEVTVRTLEEGRSVKEKFERYVR